MKTILQSKLLCKTYPIGKNDVQTILHDVNLEVAEGEFVTVMGASGSGKSTLLYSISGMDRPTSGDVDLMGQKLNDLSQAELAKLRLNSMGYVFQQPGLLRNLNLFDNIVLPAYRAKKESRFAINKRAEVLMKHLGIEGLGEKDITQASGGQLQRVAICRALINNPDILFGDEPTGALNSSTTAEVMDILADINASGTTVLLVTHDVKVASRASRILYMADGKIVDEIRLGSWKSGENSSGRESKVSKWLFECGF